MNAYILLFPVICRCKESTEGVSELLDGGSSISLGTATLTVVGIPVGIDCPTVNNKPAIRQTTR